MYQYLLICLILLLFGMGYSNYYRRNTTTLKGEFPFHEHIIGTDGSNRTSFTTATTTSFEKTALGVRDPVQGVPVEVIWEIRDVAITNLLANDLVGFGVEHLGDAGSTFFGLEYMKDAGSTSYLKFVEISPTGTSTDHDSIAHTHTDGDDWLIKLRYSKIRDADGIYTIIVAYEGYVNKVEKFSGSVSLGSARMTGPMYPMVFTYDSGATATAIAFGELFDSMGTPIVSDA